MLLVAGPVLIDCRLVSLAVEGGDGEIGEGKRVENREQPDAAQFGGCPLLGEGLRLELVKHRHERQRAERLLESVQLRQLLQRRAVAH